MSQRVNYLIWASQRAHWADTHGARVCPACGCTTTRLVRRKYGVTALRECPDCRLRFRTPKDDQEGTEEFYADEIYKAFDMPSNDELQTILDKRFAGTQVDFSPQIGVLVAAGVKPGARLLDFGSSWGIAVGSYGTRVLKYFLTRLAVSALATREKS